MSIFLVLEVLKNYFDDNRVCVNIKSDIDTLKEKQLNFNFNELPSLEKIK